MQRRVRRIEAAVWRWANVARRRPRLVLGGWLLLLLTGLGLASTLSVDTDTSGMIRDSAPFRQAQLAFEERFPELEDRILVLVRADTQDAADRFGAALAERLEAADGAVENVFAPGVDAYFRQHGLLYQSPDELTRTLATLSQAAPLIETLSQDPTLDAFLATLADAAERRDLADAQTLASVYAELANTAEARLASDPRGLSWRALFSAGEPEDPSQVLLTVTPRLDYTLLRPGRPAIEAIDAAIETTRAQTGLDAQVLVTGEPVLRSEELQSVTQGLEVAGISSLILVGVLLFFAYRSALMAAATVGLVVISIVVTAGFASLFIDALNLVSIAFTVLMVGLGVDFAIHFALHALVEHRRGKTPRASLYRTSREIGGALALTAPTTALAFFAFTPTDFAGMAQLGALAGLGVLVAFLAATSVIPALLALRVTATPLRAGPILGAGPARPRLAGWAGIIVTLAALGALFLLPQARFDADPMALRDPDAPSVQAFQLLFDDLNTVPYRLDAYAENAEAADAFSDRLAALPTVGRSVTLLDFIPEDQAEKLDLIDFASAGLFYALQDGVEPEDPGVFGPGAARLISALEDDPGMEAGRLRGALSMMAASEDAARLQRGLGEDVFVHWPFQRDRIADLLTAGPVTRDTLPPEITERFVSPDGPVRVEIIPAGDSRDLEVRRAFVEEVREIAPMVAGPARSVLEAGQVISGAMIQAAITAFLGVALILWFVLRHVGLVVSIIVPLVMAAVLTTATGVVIGLPYNFANVIVLPLLIGAGVDSGIHLALRARRSIKPFAVLSTTTPRAVVFSAFTTVGSFGTLAISAHKGTASMGLLLMIALFWTLACTLFILPWLAARLDRSPEAILRETASTKPQSTGKTDESLHGRPSC